MKMWLKVFTLIPTVLAGLAIFSSGVHAANTFTVTLPASTEVTMQDADAVLPIIVTNNSSNKKISELIFTFDTAKYNIVSSIVPPSGWCVDSISSSSITFSIQHQSGVCSGTETQASIGPGSSQTFNIVVLPLSDSSDVAGDSLESVVVPSGGFTLSGSLPTWTRRSFEVVMDASPGAVKVGEEITLTMQVINHSTTSKSVITSSPEPPTPSSAIATKTEGPFYGSTALSSDITDTSATIPVYSTAEFSSSGTMQIDSEEICYTGKSATTLTGVTRGCNGTTAASHSTSTIVYSMDTFSLASGASGTLYWKFNADINGVVDFTSVARDTTGTATSMSTGSNTVVIGDFAATLALSPENAVDGQNITVQMTVINNGASALINIVPSSLSDCPGGANESLVSGPVPSFISSLAAGSSGTFEWTFSVSGNFGESYCLTGNATADGPIVTNTAISNSGIIYNYSVTVDPTTVSSGSTSETLTWSVFNGSSCSVKEVRIDTPSGGSNWQCGSVSGPAGWSAACADKVDFVSSGASNDIPSGATQTFSITFNTTKTVSSDDEEPFEVRITPRGCGGVENFRSTTVTVAANAIVLTYTPAGPIYADGSSFYTLTATLTNGGVPIAGKTITFKTKKGTLSSSTAVTDANGEATVLLFSPISASDTNSDVTAKYLKSEDKVKVYFTGWTGSNLQYWGNLSPTSADCGSVYTFTMDVKNVGTADMVLGLGSYFAFNDSSVGGSAVFIAYLDSPVTVQANKKETLTFGSATSAGGGGDVTVDSTFTVGTYSPTQNSTPPPESGLFFTDGGTNDQYRGVTDTVTVGGTCGAVNVHTIEWHEMR